MRVLSTPIHAGITGFESPAAEYQSIALSLDELLVERPSATWLGVAQGDSMNGAGIFDGDILIIDRSVKVQTGDIIVANYNHDFVCKYINVERGILYSANELHSPVSIGEADVFSSEGVVTRSIRAHRPSPLLRY
ncbi:LexA family protein [Shewanella colwelliana]|uniref:LexA family protein n=1 Tax=Shewanella colwelliana TaxID=23 RepID=UPI0022AEA97A|nr:S24 family peptidase [Shewanella colwelliana]MCZ4337687.1 S24 family peptidase [Shewanella colwelliana]